MWDSLAIPPAGKNMDYYDSKRKAKDKDFLLSLRKRYKNANDKHLHDNLMIDICLSVVVFITSFLIFFALALAFFER